MQFLEIQFHKMDKVSKKRKETKEYCTRSKTRTFMEASQRSKSLNDNQSEDTSTEKGLGTPPGYRSSGRPRKSLLAKDTRDLWLVDSGSNVNVCNNKKWFIEPNQLTDASHHLIVGDNQTVHVESMGDAYLQIGDSSMIVKDCYYAPGFDVNILSVSKMYKEGYHFKLDKKVHVFYSNKMCCVGEMQNGLYILAPKPQSTPSSIMSITTLQQMVKDIRMERNTIDWHKRLGHMPCSEIRSLMELGYLPEVDISNDIDCEDCKKPVKYKRHLATRQEKAQACLECVHVHICKLMEVVSYTKHALFVTFVDEYSDFGQVYLLKKYDEVPDAFHQFDRKVRIQHDTKVKKFKIEVELGDMDSLRDLLRPTLVNLAIPYEYATIYEHSRIGAAERYNIRLKHSIELMYKETLL